MFSPKWDVYLIPAWLRDITEGAIRLWDKTGRMGKRAVKPCLLAMMTWLLHYELIAVRTACMRSLVGPVTSPSLRGGAPKTPLLVEELSIVDDGWKESFLVGSGVAADKLSSQ